MKNLLNNQPTSNTNNDLKPSLLARLIGGTVTVADKTTTAAVIEAKLIDAHVNVVLTIRAEERKVLLARAQTKINAIEKDGIAKAMTIREKQQLLAELQKAQRELEATPAV